MNSDKKRSEFSLDQMVAEIRREAVDERMAEEAAGRVWSRIAAGDGLLEMLPDVGHIRGCPDFQALIPAYLVKRLPEARAMLVQDHLLECVACRHVLNDARAGIRTPLSSRVVKFASRPKRSNWVMAWAIAAVLLLGVAIGLIGPERWFGGSSAAVASVNGSLFQVSDGGSVALASGVGIGANQELRTGKSSAAVVRLSDGSLVEMNERADLWMSRSWRGTTIHLERGNIIVRAAPQGHGRLYVATRDCLVAVKGTIFDVDEGMKGARVSVIQGEVQVTQDGKARLLNPGEQLTTRASLVQVPVKQEVAWSANSGEYLALLSEFEGLRKQIDAIPGPALRYDSTLLNLVPEDTVFYAGIPNIGSTVSEANRLLQDRIQQSEVLQAWWKQKQASGEAQKAQEVIDRIRSFSEYLGNEIVIAMPSGEESPILLAEVKRPDFATFLQAQLADMNHGGGPAPALLTNLASIGTTQNHQPLIFLKDNILVVAVDGSQLRKTATLIDQPGSSGFASTPFYAAIRQAYQGGAGWLLCADMEQILAHSVHQGEARAARVAEEKHGDVLQNESAGLKDMRYLVMESKDVSGQTQNQATLTFSQDRRGIASWLAAPSPMGTLDFVSPKASFAVSFVVKEPRSIVQDILDFTQSQDSGDSQDLAEFEAKTGVNLQNDLAGALGGEMTFALDGAVLPTPSWKVALEVNDPTRLQGAIEKLVAAANQQASNEAGGREFHLGLSQQTAGGRTFYDLQVTRPTSQSGHSGQSDHSGSPSLSSPTEIEYTFVDGYLLAAPDRASLLSSIQNRETGYSLSRSSDFLNRLPRDGYANFSGLVYQNLWSAVAPIAEQLKSTSVLTPAQRQSIDAFSQNSSPSLICAYGEADRITVANTGSFFGVGFESLLGAGNPGPFSVLQIIGKSAGRSN
jgi:hypothetical protein